MHYSIYELWQTGIWTMFSLFLFGTICCKYSYFDILLSIYNHVSNLFHIDLFRHHSCIIFHLKVFTGLDIRCMSWPFKTICYCLCDCSSICSISLHWIISWENLTVENSILNKHTRSRFSIEIKYFDIIIIFVPDSRLGWHTCIPVHTIFSCYQWSMRSLSSILSLNRCLHFSSCMFHWTIVLYMLDSWCKMHHLYSILFKSLGQISFFRIWTFISER